CARRLGPGLCRPSVSIHAWPRRRAL
ncbi:uncharacterized protein METZ01_LOCUS316062, partial [marine metagenome]